MLLSLNLPQLCDEWGYLLVGLAAALPCWLLPLVLPNKADEGRPWYHAYWFKVGSVDM